MATQTQRPSAQGVPSLHVVIDVPDHQIDAEAAFWARATGWPLGRPWPGHPELRSFEPPEGRPYVHLQRVEPAARVHLDLDSQDPGQWIAAAVDRGARLMRGETRRQVLDSPSGFPFCVVPSTAGRPPDPTRWEQGHRSRPVQLCIDSPAPLHELEVAFWRDLLADGRWVDSPAPEFAGKWHDDDASPIQLLFQRLDEQDGTVRAHLDIGTDDQAAEVARLRELGARDVGRGPGGWHVLRDPAGLLFCVTENSPEQTSHRDLG